MTRWASGHLDERSDLSQFDCGMMALNEWLFGRALEAQTRGTAATYVRTVLGTDRVVAYYAIAPHQVRREQVPSSMAGGVTVIPAYLLAPLALDVTVHGQGLGGELLHDAMDRIVTAADMASGRLIVVDAIDGDRGRVLSTPRLPRRARPPAPPRHQGQHSPQDARPLTQPATGTHCTQP